MCKPNLEEHDRYPILIREVWAYNIHYEFDLIRQIVRDYPFVSMDTEFPGVIRSPKMGNAKSHGHRRKFEPTYHYKYLKANVDSLKLIQVGLTLTDHKGNLPHFGTNNSYLWEFNFCDFDVECDPHNSSSINMLRRQGIDFERNVLHGVNSFYFGDMLLRSGLLFNESVVWVTFHSCYDFGYLVKILTRLNLPNRLEDFLKVLKFYFGNKVYDIKHMMRHCNALYGGLEQVASTLKISRAIGKCHQAGSDSLLTRQIFQKLVELYFPNMNEIKKHAGILFGLEITT